MRGLFLGQFRYSATRLRCADAIDLATCHSRRPIAAVLHLFGAIDSRDNTTPSTTPKTRPHLFIGLAEILAKPAVLFSLFLAYLIVLPILGMLLAGIIFVFLLQGYWGVGSPPITGALDGRDLGSRRNVEPVHFLGSTYVTQWHHLFFI
ncbi:MAG: hypothetical protein CM1200mP41_01980 [Gammaproteobacteria bacterium]|nr:MAG: hypothetical protein CM1200mP41_01980 [Gammaproteobacteria bacterium]